MYCDEGCKYAYNRRCYHPDVKELAKYVGDINKSTPKWCPLSKTFKAIKAKVRVFLETGIWNG